MKVYDLFTLHFVDATFLLCHKFHFHSNLRPVVASSIKYPWPYSSIGTISTSVPILSENNIVLCHSVNHSVCTWCSQGVKYHNPLTIFLKKSLVAFNCFHSIIFSFTLLPCQHYSIDTTIHVYVVHVVNLSTVVPSTHRRIGSNPTTGDREILLLFSKRYLRSSKH